MAQAKLSGESNIRTHPGKSKMLFLRNPRKDFISC
jgi:hypothetical protein